MWLFPKLYLTFCLLKPVLNSRLQWPSFYHCSSRYLKAEHQEKHSSTKLTSDIFAFPGKVVESELWMVKIMVTRKSSIMGTCKINCTSVTIILQSTVYHIIATRRKANRYITNRLVKMQSQVSCNLNENKSIVKKSSDIWYTCGMGYYWEKCFQC